MTYTSGPLRVVYENLPYPGKVVMASLYGWKQRHDRYRETFRKMLAFLQDSQYWPNDRLCQYQLQQRDSFLRRAVELSDYYRQREVYAAGGHADFAELPLLTKAEVHMHEAQIVRRDLHATAHRWVHTSGTTGTALKFPVSDEAFQREYAYRALHNGWGGVDLFGRGKIAFCAGHPVAYINRQRPPFWVRDLANNMLMLSSYHLTARNLPHYVRELERFQPLMISGYPSSLYLLALAYERFGTGKLRLRSVFTSSESLFDFQREKMASAFGVKVFNYYGNTEMCSNAMQCEHGNIHLKMEYSYVEVLNAQNKPCAPGETGRLVCTGFGNPAFPLIRYEIGDVVTLASNPQCPCGRSGLMLERILGRVEDYVVTPDGRLVGRLDHIFKEAQNVEQAQIVQHSVNEVILRVVKNPRFTLRDEELLLAAARNRLGRSLGIRFEYVDSIPRMASGKFRFIESTLDQKKQLASLFS